MLSSKVKLFTKSYKGVRIVFSANQSISPKGDAASEITPIKTDKPRRAPFMKNVFLGIVDDIYLQYPSPKSNKTEYVKKLKNDLTNSLEHKDLGAHDKFKILVKNGLLKCQLPKEYGGTDMLSSEVLNLYEELQLDPNLSVLLEVQNSFVLQTILSYGSDEIKQNYLQKVLSGEFSGAYALSEGVGGSDPTSIKAISKQEGDCYKISGEKIWVTNGQFADFFLVFANNVVEKRSSMIKDLSVFLVDKCDDIYIKKHNLFGLNECGISTLEFKNVTVPKSNLVGKLGEGFQIAGNGFKYHKYIMLISVLNNLKYFFSSVISYIHECKQFPVDLKDCELVKNKLAAISNTAYVLESMLYLTSGVIDSFTVDVSLESAILQLYVFEKGLEAISQCMDLLGSRAYDSSYPFERIWRDLKGFTLCNKSNDMTRLYIALIGLDHAGNNLSDVVKQSRNPFHFPNFALKRIISNSRQARDKPKLQLNLFMNLHPNLKGAAEKLEYCILRFQYVIETVLTRHGSETFKRQLELKRIADIACDIYSMVAVLSRASKSYCTGVQFCDQEVTIANLHCYNNYMKIKSNIDGILNGEMKANDVSTFEIGSHVLNWNSYSFIHPLKPNIV